MHAQFPLLGSFLLLLCPAMFLRDIGRHGLRALQPLVPCARRILQIPEMNTCVGDELHR